MKLPEVQTTTLFPNKNNLPHYKSNPWDSCPNVLSPGLLFNSFNTLQSYLQPIGPLKAVLATSLLAKPSASFSALTWLELLAVNTFGSVLIHFRKWSFKITYSISLASLSKYHLQICPLTWQCCKALGLIINSIFSNQRYLISSLAFQYCLYSSSPNLYVWSPHVHNCLHEISMWMFIRLCGSRSKCATMQR